MSTRRSKRKLEEDEEEEQEEIDSSDKLATCLINKKKEYENLKSNVLDIAYITSILEATINNNEIQNCGNLNMWINFRNLYNYELSKISSSYPDREKKAFMNMLFKLDSIHDFFGERTPYKGEELKTFENDVLDVLGFNDSKIIDTVNAIRKGHFENDLFMWLIFDGLRIIIKDENRDKYNKKLMLTESIQNYITRVSTDKNKSAFTIDAGLVDFITFRDFLKNISIYRSGDIDIGDELIILQYYKHIENINDKDFPSVDKILIKEAKICIQNMLISCLKDNNKYADTNPSDDKNFFKKIFETEEAPITKKGCKKKYTHRFIANILARIKGKDRIKITDEKLNPELFNNDNILKMFITYSQAYFNELIRINTKEFDNCNGPINKNEIKEEKLIQRTFETIEQDSKEFRVISPQKFDSNRTTGGSWTEESINNIEYLEVCNTDDEKKSSIIKSNCSFQVLEDTCYFYSMKSGLSPDEISSVKEFIFEVSNDKYPIKKIIVVSSSKFDSLSNLEIIQLDKSVYKYKDQTLYCKNAPGVTELLRFYEYFSSMKQQQKGKKKKTEEVNLYTSSDVLNNILTIKRAGDYSQIWFCKRYNQEKRGEKLFFMSNDRMSASFCLLEQVPFVCLIRNYGVYFNPFLPDPIEGSISYTQYSIKDKIKLIQNKNIQIMDNFSNCLGNNNVFEDYLSFINENKNTYINNDKYLTTILNYLDRIIFNQNNNNYLDDTIDEEKISIPIIIGEVSGKKPLISIYEYIENIAEKESQTLCTDILKNTIIKIFNLDLEIIPEITPQEDDIIDDDIGKEIYLRQKYGVKVVNALINTDDKPYQTAALQQELNKSKANIKCKNIVSVINNCVRLYNEFIKNIYKDTNDKYTDDIDDDSIDYYIVNYNVLLNCLTPIYKEIKNNTVKKAIRYVLPDEEFEEDMSIETPSSFAFSFENGLTYYQTYPSIPKKINTTKFKLANNVYVMDRKGYLKIEGSNLRGDVQLTNRNPKSVSYTDGTKISYYSF